MGRGGGFGAARAHQIRLDHDAHIGAEQRLHIQRGEMALDRRVQRLLIVIVTADDRLNHASTSAPSRMK